ncbi:MAG: hypothetical protein HRT58_11100 [Crocinitomicaceae bacterium]|nr:hypothetical protein [Flavobacteriales bacterium]NQZ36203.1 hypothetical protein [Crocinitomicaceae bacterium]PHR35454.1 MAG: hypothetical protein COA38_02010 [Fluviicola sp.]
MEDNLIDNELNESPKDVIIGIMRWWERKRLLFNMMTLGIIMLAVIPFTISKVDGVSYILSGPFIIQSLFYFLFINIAYCAGWGIQLLGYYYFKIQYDSNALDYVLFIIGSLITGLVTYHGYLEYIFY